MEVSALSQKTKGSCIGVPVPSSPLGLDTPKTQKNPGVPHSLKGDKQASFVIGDRTLALRTLTRFGRPDRMTVENCRL